MKFKKPLVSYFSKKAFFTSGDVKRYLARLDVKEGYEKLLLHNMVRNGELFRLKKGVYTFTKNEEIAGYAFRPFYYGMEFALTLRKIWTQQSDPVIITRSKANPGVRIVLGTKVTVRRINKNAFFGFEYINYSGLFLPVSAPEKIILDFLYFKFRIDEGTIEAIIKQSNVNLLERYAQKLGNLYLDKVDRLLGNFDVSR